MTDRGLLFVVVHHSGLEKTRCLLASLGAQSGEDTAVTVWVVDNSTDPSERVPDTFHESSISVEIIRSDNKGYFGSANEAMRRGVASFDHLIICNNDLIFDRTFCATLETKKYPQNVLAIYPSVVDSNGVSQNPRVVCKVSVFRLIAYHLYYSNYSFSRVLARTWSIAAKIARIARVQRRGRAVVEPSSGCYEILLGVGACIILTPAYIRQCGNLPDNVFLYGEEALLAGRVKRVGGSILYDGSLLVCHEEHSTVGKLQGRTYWDIQRASSRVYLPELWKLRRL